MIANLFLSAFAGTWTCGNARYHAQWRISAAAGKSEWAQIQYGPIDAPDGTAFAGSLPQEHAYVYNDFHNDGSFARLSSPGPVNGVWTWTGTYYPRGGAADFAPYITWAIASNGTIERHFAKKTDKGLIDSGSDVCTRT